MPRVDIHSCAREKRAHSLIFPSMKLSSALLASLVALEPFVLVSADRTFAKRLEDTPPALACEQGCVGQHFALTQNRRHAQHMVARRRQFPSVTMNAPSRNMATLSSKSPCSTPHSNAASMRSGAITSSSQRNGKRKHTASWFVGGVCLHAQV